MPGHILRGDHRVDDGFLSGVHRSREERVNHIVGEGVKFGNAFLISKGGIGVGGRKSQKDIAASIPADGTSSCHAQGSAFCQPFELMGEQWRVGGENNDQGTIILLERIFAVRPNGVLLQMVPNGDARNGQLIAPAEVGLRERADGPAAEFLRLFSG